MALADHLQEVEQKGPGTPCSVAVLLKTLPPEDADTLRDMLGTKENWGKSAQFIFNVLVADGHKVGYQTINRHRGLTCRCYR